MDTKIKSGRGEPWPQSLCVLSCIGARRAVFPRRHERLKGKIDHAAGAIVRRAVGADERILPLRKLGGGHGSAAKEIIGGDVEDVAELIDEFRVDRSELKLVVRYCSVSNMNKLG